jgi:thiol-disulfide isomerase/thioredoxin
MRMWTTRAFSAAWRALVAGAAVTVATLGVSYGVLLATGKPAWAQTSPAPDWKALATGEMVAFVPKAKPEPLADLKFEDGAGKPLTIKDFQGKIVVLNLWATWCAPCRKEMPSLDRLQVHFTGKPFEVLALSVDRGGVAASKRFLEQIKVSNLALYIDPTARQHTTLRAVGLPTTILIDGKGNEIGRLSGHAEWDSAEAKALIDAALKTL